MQLSLRERARQELSGRRKYKAKTPKHLTDYKTGSMMDAIREVETLEELARYRQHTADAKDASPQTRRKWARALDAREAALKAAPAPA